MYKGPKSSVSPFHAQGSLPKVTGWFSGLGLPLSSPRKHLLSGSPGTSFPFTVAWRPGFQSSVLRPFISEGQGSLVCCSPWGCRELDLLTEQQEMSSLVQRNAPDRSLALASESNSRLEPGGPLGGPSRPPHY